MSENKTVVNIFGWSTKIWIVYGILGYFVYSHNIDAVLGVMVLSFLVGNRKLEEFFITNNLFISSVPAGIMVTDTEKAKELITKYIED